MSDSDLIKDEEEKEEAIEDLEEQKQKALNAGMNKHLSKPIELGDLQNALLEYSH